jgi:hypothetical protein
MSAPDPGPVTYYRGKDRHGNGRGGGVYGSPATLIRRLFGQRWLWAVAVRDGIEVGGIGYDTESGQNVWWAEN